MLNIKQNMVSKRHIQTEEQSENTIITPSQTLRHCIEENAKDWDTILSSLEFELNSTKSKSFGLAPVEIDMGFIPPTELAKRAAVISKEEFDVLKLKQMFQTKAREHLQNSQTRQVFYANEKRSDVQFNKGDLFMLNIESTKMPSRADLPNNWRPKFVGALRMKEKMRSVTYKIKLQPSMKKAHNVFYVSCLKDY